eukprot:TRINITY_DN2173_c0_g1_i1.p1 TRINITY_DN2173_c0_g1~~TRINITY_DN2173_c0_g1_i1.p1  ORF type:complete len:332 (-),score=63.31 TRINITY_DN2173_c0_g1_i1:51-1046(-)
MSANKPASVKFSVWIRQVDGSLVQKRLPASITTATHSPPDLVQLVQKSLKNSVPAPRNVIYYYLNNGVYRPVEDAWDWKLVSASAKTGFLAVMLDAPNLEMEPLFVRLTFQEFSYCHGDVALETDVRDCSPLSVLERAKEFVPHEERRLAVLRFIGRGDGKSIPVTGAAFEPVTIRRHFLVDSVKGKKFVVLRVTKSRPDSASIASLETRTSILSLITETDIGQNHPLETSTFEFERNDPSASEQGLIEIEATWIPHWLVQPVAEPESTPHHDDDFVTAPAPPPVLFTGALDATLDEESNVEWPDSYHDDFYCTDACCVCTTPFCQYRPRL